MKKPKISGVLRCSMHSMRGICLNAQMDTLRYCKALNDDCSYHFRSESSIVVQLTLALDQDYSKISKAIGDWEARNTDSYFETVDSHGYDPFDPANEWRFK